MKRMLTLLILTVPSMGFAEYLDGWNYKNFYEAVNVCRSSIIYPAAQDYEAQGLRKGRTKLSLKDDLIANTPVFESVASATCYCALNDFAKDKTYSEYKDKPEEPAEYMQTPRCKNKVKEVMEQLKRNPKSNMLR